MLRELLQPSDLVDMSRKVVTFVALDAYLAAFRVLIGESLKGWLLLAQQKTEPVEKPALGSEGSLPEPVQRRKLPCGLDCQFCLGESGHICLFRTACENRRTFRSTALASSQGSSSCDRAGIRHLGRLGFFKTGSWN